MKPKNKAQYYANESSWWDLNTPITVYWMLPGKKWGYFGGIRTSQDQLIEGYPQGQEYWSTCLICRAKHLNHQFI